MKDTSNREVDINILDKKAEKEKMLKKMSKELVKGSIMLQESCPVCGTPLLMKKDTKKMYCFSCDKEVIHEKDLGRNDEKKNFTGAKKTSVSLSGAGIDIHAKLLALIAGKLESQIINIAEETNLELLDKKIDIAERLVALIKSLEDIK